MSNDVGKRFTQLLAKLKLTDLQREDGRTKHAGVRKCLNQHYYNLNSETANSRLVGSWGKSTEVRPPRDIDVLFVLPDTVYYRYEQKPWGANKQSMLLQEVKLVLQNSYGATRMRADGQVVLVPFVSYAVEVVPAFKLTDGQHFICDTHAGGSYKRTDPDAEQQLVRSSNATTKGNTRDLIRLMKAWQRTCSVPLKSFLIELAAVDFLASWEHAGNSAVYYDYMSRDFFAFLLRHTWGTAQVPGTGETIDLGADWESKARSAHGRAVKACNYEASDKETDAWWEWTKIFGDDVPLMP